MRRIGTFIISAILPAVTLSAGSFRAADGSFLLDNRPFVVKAAELHYPRIPRPYWDQRIKMCKALGMNTICVYAFWNVHEPVSGSFDFEGNNDIAEFIRLCRENDMFVILRPGPYVCAEWEMGGLPWWLLKNKNIRLRESDPRFLDAVDRFQKELAERVGQYTIDNGGSIIMIQVENEYGSYGKDKHYVSQIRDILRGHYGDEIEMFQCDWSSNFLDNGLDDLVWTLNFGTGADISAEFAPLRKARPNSPLMCSEFWSGWFDKWGAGHETRAAEAMIQGIDEMLANNISFSLYMTHGGTNWGHWAGANSPGFAPDVTSYDYDAPISENGCATKKYHLLRELMARYADQPLPAIPDTVATADIPRIAFQSVAPIFDNLPECINDTTLRTMEDYDFGYGSIIYSTILENGADNASLTIDEAHDFAIIYVNGRIEGTIDRRLGEKTISLSPYHAGSRLDIFVEAMGRINFGRAIKDHKGIVGHVYVNDGETAKDLTDSKWSVYRLPDTPRYYASMTVCADAGSCKPGLYRGNFSIGKISQEDMPDTWLDMSSWGKGMVYVNGYPLGRFWNIGPQQTLYLPGCFLNDGDNEIMVFDILGPSQPVAKGCSSPVLDKLNNQAARTSYDFDVDLLLQFDDFISDESSSDSGWRQSARKKAARARYVALYVDSDNRDASIAELHLISEDGSRIPRENWRAIYADSSMTIGNHTPDKAFDLQETTYWQAADNADSHVIVIDLGAEYDICGFDYMIPTADDYRRKTKLLLKTLPYKPSVTDG